MPRTMCTGSVVPAEPILRGDAMTLFSADEMDQVKAIETYIEEPLERVVLEDFEYAFTTLLQKQEVSRPVRRGRNRGYVPADTMPMNMKGRRR